LNNPDNLKQGTSGTRFEGAPDEQSTARAVREMFSAIAPRYDLLNHLLSMNIDRLWWKRTARIFAHVLRRPEARALDLCCGTGDMTMALYAHRPEDGVPVLGIDFAHPMLVRSLPKFRGKRICAVEGDALRLPLSSAQLDLVTSAFGFRNLANYDAGLREIARVLKSGGEIGILDFSEPKGMLGKFYRFYFKQVLPRIGTVISGVRGPYAYLPASVERFPAPEEMLERMRAAGFTDVSWTPYTFGIAGLFRGKKVCSRRV
jgi:demethylmenaquinone methyltransferase / 2-methoxy-6-polyprenyl-1,4-benzoquinol methylase